MAKDNKPVDQQAVVNSFLRWLADEQPNIIRCESSHATLYNYCKPRGLVTPATIAKELLKT